MELSLPYQLSALLLLLLSVYFIHSKRTTNSQSKAPLPPGPWTLPFISSVHYLVQAACGVRRQHEVLCNLARSYGPVMLLRMGQIDVVVITSREAAKEVMKIQDELFQNRPVLSGMIKCFGCTDMIFTNGPYWRQMRQICVTETLSSKRVKAISSIRLEELHSMLRRLATLSDKAPVRLVETISEFGNNIICRVTFGERCKRQVELMPTLKETIELVVWISSTDVFPSLTWLDGRLRRKFDRVCRVLHSILDEIIQEHLEKKNQYKNGREEEMEHDLVDVLIKAMETQDLKVPITLDGIKAIIFDMLFGGVNTTAVTIEWAMTELVKHPEVMEKVQAEIRHVAGENNAELNEHDLIKLNYLNYVIKETLRLHPPLPLLIARQSTETCQLLGYTIPSGARVLINGWALGRNQDYWKNADEFIPERFEGSGIDFIGNDFEYVPFGAGRRRCPGMNFGMAMVKVALAKLLLHFDWNLPNGVEPINVDMAEQLGEVCCKKNSLSLIPILRVPLPDI